MSEGATRAEKLASSQSLRSCVEENERQRQSRENSASADGPVPGNGPQTEVAQKAPRGPVDLTNFPHIDFIAAELKVHGSLAVVAERCGMTLSRLDRAIELQSPTKWPKLIRYLKKIKQDNAEYRAMTLGAIEADISRRALLYKSEALDALHALASMPVGDNSANNQVKLLAAAKLYQTGEKQMGDTIQDTLRTLNDEFVSQQKRISGIRKTVYEVQYSEPRAIEVETLSSQTSDVQSPD